MRLLKTLHVAARLGIVAGIIALVAGSAATPARAQAQPLTVNYGILNYTAADWPLMLAISQGFFKKDGVNLTVVTLGSPPNVINALASNAVNMGDDGTDSYIAAVAHNLPIKMVAAGFAVDPYSLIVAPSITSIDQLKGKTIMLGTKQDVTAITLGAMIKPRGLSQNDFSIVVAGSTPARYAALLSGNAQGSMLLQPFDLLAETKGYHVLSTGEQLLKNWLFTTVAVNVGWAATNRPAVAATLRALHEATLYGYAHKQDAIATLISYTHTTPEIAEKAYDLDFNQWKAFREDTRVTAAQLDQIAKQQIQFGVITAEPAFDAMYDGSYAQAVNGH